MRSESCRGWKSISRILSTVSGILLLTLAVLSHPAAVSAQDEDPGEQIRVAQERSNVHQGWSTGRVVLVQVPEDTVFTVVSRRGEWLEVELSTDLRNAEDVTVIRWYENEETGWVHQSWVEVVEDGSDEA